MFNFKNLFKKQPKDLDLKDDKGNVIHKSSLSYENGDQRFLRLSDDSCAIVIHGDNNVEVVFTKEYDPVNQTITKNEEELMALALFMKQDGFLEMITDEFRKIAKEKIKYLTEENETK